MLIVMVAVISAATGWALIQWADDSNDLLYVVDGIYMIDDKVFDCTGTGLCQDTEESTSETVLLMTFNILYADDSGAVFKFIIQTSMVMNKEGPKRSLYNYMGESDKGEMIWSNINDKDGSFIYYIDERKVPVRVDMEVEGLMATATIDD